jgi:hypothetical protein
LFVILKKTAMYAFGRDTRWSPVWKSMARHSWIETGERCTAWANYHEQISKAVYNGKALDPEIQEIIIVERKKLDKNTCRLTLK